MKTLKWLFFLVMVGITLWLDFKLREEILAYFYFELKARQRLESLASGLLSALQPSANSCCLELV